MDSAEYAHEGRTGRVDVENVSLIRRLDRTGVPLLVARLLLGCLFIYMGALKVAHPIEFLKQVRLYHMMPEDPPYFLTVTAITLPWVEIVTGIALILGIGLRGSALLMVGMLAVFTPAILLRALAIRAETGIPFFDIKFDCGCGAGVVITWRKLLENTGLIVLALLVLVSQSRRFCLPNLFCRTRPSA
jgi:putative oxidoreductase